MHYQHQYHAGNFADVIKHVCVHRTLALLSRKPSPWCVVDTHAGAGAYPLNHPASERTGEWRDGVGRLTGPLPGAPAVVLDWLAAVERCNGEPLDGRRPPRLYPGSPWLAATAARPNDRVVLFERVPVVAEQLREETRLAAFSSHCAVHERDGYEAHALLPPAEKRGLVLIDPPYERPDEFAAVEALLNRALARFSNGVYAIWYPAKKQFDHQRFLRRVRAAHPAPDMINLWLDTGAPSEGQMHACGMLLINPPYPLADDMRIALDWLLPKLAQGPGAAATVNPLTATPPAMARKRR